MDLNTIFDYCVRILIALLVSGFAIKIFINIKNKNINNIVDDHSEHNNTKYNIKDNHSVNSNITINGDVNITNTNSDKHAINDSSNKSAIQAEHVSLKDYLQSKLNDNKEPKREIMNNWQDIENEFDTKLGKEFEKTLSLNEKKILLLLNEEPRLSIQKIATRTGLSAKSVSVLLKKLKDLCIIEWQGSRKNGSWIINK